ncbi:MAG: helix-turn-helix domain-containing protein [Candidatus Marinamargulisbacteria bacterium]
MASMLNAIATELIQATYTLNFILSGIFLIGPCRANRLLGLLFLIVAFVPLQFEWIYTKQLFYYPQFFLTYIPPILFFGPCLIIYLNNAVFGHKMPQRAILAHLIIPVIASVALLPMLGMSGDEKLTLINALYYQTTSLEYHFISLLCVGSIGVYTIMLFQELPTIRRAKTKTRLFFVMFSLTMIGVMFSAIGLASLLTHSLTMLFWGNLFFSMVVLAAYGLHVRFRAFLPQLVDEIRQTNERKSQLAGINIEKALSNLNYVMSVDRAYIDPNLCLSTLAEKVRLTGHQLSELINHELGKNFNAYVMAFRVDAAIKKLKNEPHKTILAIALSVGFNSQSAFYNAFKKVTGKAPSHYRD